MKTNHWLSIAGLCLLVLPAAPAARAQANFLEQGESAPPSPTPHGAAGS